MTISSKSLIQKLISTAGKAFAKRADDTKIYLKNNFLEHAKTTSIVVASSTVVNVASEILHMTFTAGPPGAARIALSVLGVKLVSNCLFAPHAFFDPDKKSIDHLLNDLKLKTPSYIFRNMIGGFAIFAAANLYVAPKVSEYLSNDTGQALNIAYQDAAYKVFKSKSSAGACMQFQRTSFSWLSDPGKFCVDITLNSPLTIEGCFKARLRESISSEMISERSKDFPNSAHCPISVAKRPAGFEYASAFDDGLNYK